MGLYHGRDANVELAESHRRVSEDYARRLLVNMDSGVPHVSSYLVAQ